MSKWVYSFGAGHNEGRADMRNLLGGKGANLAEMASIGLPVPPGFTITTELCTAFYDNGRQYPGDLDAQVKEALGRIEAAVGLRFGDRAHPLLVSVRSGARVSMPGMMDTVLNLGLNDETVLGLAEASGDARFAWDSYRRFIQMYGSVVLGVDHHRFEEIIESAKIDAGVTEDTALTPGHWRQVVTEYKTMVEADLRKPFPQDPAEQLWGAIGAVFGSWMNPRANTYRRLHDIPPTWGTAVNVQAMVFGNMGADCATGVCFTRDPSTGEDVFYGEYLVNAQGEDVVAGIRTPQPLSKLRAKPGEVSMEEALPAVYQDLVRVRTTLETHYQDMQDIEFTVQQQKLYMLQTRSGKRTAAASLRIAVEMAEAGLIDRNEAIRRVNPASLDQLLHPTLDPKAPRTLISKGLPASPGAASGAVVFNSDEAEMRAAKGEPVVLVRIETSPEDIHGMHAARGILTTRGGMTSHAAVVARGMGRPCVAGAGGIAVDYGAQTLTAGGRTIRAGETITLDGATGEVFAGRRRHDRAAVVRRVRHADGLGRLHAPHEDPRQRRNAAGCGDRPQVRCRGHRAVPHRAHVLRPGAYRRRPADDHGQRRGRPPHRAGQAAAVPAGRLPRPVPYHGGAARHHPPAGPAAARVPAPPGSRTGRRRRRAGRGSGGPSAAGPTT